MNLLAHLIAADIRRFRLPMAMWVAVVAAESAFEALKPLAAGDPASLYPLALAASLVWLARVLLFAALVPLVVQAHPLVGSDAFWMTRPVAPHALLLSKLILLASLLLIVPLACDVVVMAAYRVPAGDIALVGLQSTLFRSMLLIVLMAAAAITLNLSRFAMLGGAVLLSLSVLVTVASMIAFSRLDDSPGVAYLVADRPTGPGSRGPDQTAALAGSLVFIAAGLAGLVIQYRRRSVRLSVVVGIAGTIVAWLVASAWPWPLIQQRLLVPDWASSASALRLRADSVNIVLDSNVDVWAVRPNRWRTGSAKVWMNEVAPEWLATARLARASLELDSDMRLSSHGHGYPASIAVDDKDEPPLHRALRNVLGVHSILGSSTRLRGDTAVVLVIRDDELTRYRDLSRQRSALGKYRGQFLVDLTHLGIAAVLPLDGGKSFQEGAYRLTIAEVRAANGRLAVRVTSSQTNTMFDRRPRPAYSFYLRNRQLGEAAAGLLSPRDSPVFQPFLGAFAIDVSSESSGFAPSAGLILFPKTLAFPGDETSLDAAWLNGAELVVVRTVTEGSVSRTLEIDGVSLSERADGSRAPAEK